MNLKKTNMNKIKDWVFWKVDFVDLIHFNLGNQEKREKTLRKNEEWVVTSITISRETEPIGDMYVLCAYICIWYMIYIMTYIRKCVFEGICYRNLLMQLMRLRSPLISCLQSGKTNSGLKTKEPQTLVPKQGEDRYPSSGRQWAKMLSFAFSAYFFNPWWIGWCPNTLMRMGNLVYSLIQMLIFVEISSVSTVNNVSLGISSSKTNLMSQLIEVTGPIRECLSNSMPTNLIEEMDLITWKNRLSKFIEGG